ncbi:hypothetical protein BYT27DRAFT_7116009, partial [Phlegmacium glaucopus]
VCEEEDLPPLQLIKWIQTQWGSMFDLAINKFCLVADVSNKVPKLNKKKYADYQLTAGEWNLLELIKEKKIAPVQSAIRKGLEKLKKWYMTIDESNTYFICLGE